MSMKRDYRGEPRDERTFGRDERDNRNFRELEPRQNTGYGTPDEREPARGPYRGRDYRDDPSRPPEAFRPREYEEYPPRPVDYRPEPYYREEFRGPDYRPPQDLSYRPPDFAVQRGYDDRPAYRGDPRDYRNPIDYRPAEPYRRDDFMPRPDAYGADPRYYGAPVPMPGRDVDPRAPPRDFGPPPHMYREDFGRRDMPPGPIVPYSDDRPKSDQGYIGFNDSRGRGRGRGGRGRGRGGANDRGGFGGGHRDDEDLLREGKVQLETNMFPVTFKRLGQIYYRYELDVFNINTGRPDERASKDVKRAYLQEIIAKHYSDFAFAFDGQKTVYANTRLIYPASVLADEKFQDIKKKLAVKREGATSPKEKEPINSAVFHTTEVHIPVGERSVVQLRYIQEEQISDQMLQMALSFSFFLGGNAIIKNRSIFFNENRQPLEKFSDLFIFSGIFQSFRTASMGIILNVDLSYLLILQDFKSVLEWMNLRAKAENFSSLSDAFRNRNFCETISDNLKGAEVVLTYGHKRKHKLQGIDMKFNANNAEFQDPSGRAISVDAYFRLKYDIKLEFPQVPLLLEVSKPRDGGDKKAAWFPAELCLFAKGQTRKSELNAEERSAMIEKTRTEPFERMKRVKESAQKLIDNKHWQKFGIEIEVNRPCTIEATILPAQAIKYSNATEAPQQRGVWNLIGKRFLSTPNTKLFWAVLCIRDQLQLTEFIDNFHNVANSAGMDIERHPHIEMSDRDRFEETLRNMPKYTKQKPAFIVILLPDSKKLRHDGIKRIADTELGVPTKCICADAKSKRPKLTNMGVLANIAASINAKLLEGRNWSITPEDVKDMIGIEPTNLMVFGLDVCHGMRKSSASLCMSRNDEFNQYYTYSKDQGARKEIVSGIKEMMAQCLKIRMEEHGHLPDNILFYRDGVGEGMYDQVLSEEAKLMTDAFMEVYPKGQLPKMTLVIVQKRNHFRGQVINSRGKDTNPPVGTLVDTVVTDTATKNFYLYSHKALQGTARPTHYQVLLDEMDIFARLPRFTYALAHLHQGCTKSVSLPAPVFFADKAAGRVHDYYDGKQARDAIAKGLFMI